MIMSRTTVELTSLSQALPAAFANKQPFTKPQIPPSRPSSLQENEPPNPAEITSEPMVRVSKGSTAAIIASVTCITGIGSFLAGVVTVALPVIAIDLHLDKNVLLWPASIYSLTCGCSLLLLGSVADVVGSRWMYLLGCLLQCLFTLACGLSKTGTQLVIFRAFSGIAASFCLPSAVSIINSSFPPGRRRNMAFASMGGGQPIGFGIGLVLGGVLAGSIGWQWAFHFTAVVNLIVFVLAAWQLPKNEENAPSVSWQRLISDIDWIGAFIASTSLAMLSYVLAAVTGAASDIRSPTNVAILTIALALIPGFIFWEGRQEHLQQPALIPNTLWRNKAFSVITLNVFFTWGTFNASEQFLNFFLQTVQRNSPLQAALRLGPSPIAGILTNIAVGLMVHRVRADGIVITTLILSSLCPLLMAIVHPSWSYWAFIFPATSLNPMGSDALFTVSSLLITSMFPAKTQGLAGGVVNTISQIGKSVGLALTGLIANSVTEKSSLDPEARVALLKGYRAAFWFCFALNGTTLCVSLWGLRKIGKVGRKKD